MRTLLRPLVLAVALAALAGCAARTARDAESLTAVNAALGPALAKVAIYLKYDDGDEPQDVYFWDGSDSPSRPYGRSGGSLVDNQQPVMTSGFLLAEDVVLTEDPMLEDRFIDHIEVEMAGAKYGAAMEKFALNNDGVFLKLDAPVKGVACVKFEPEAAGPYRTVMLAPGRDGEWNVRVRGLNEREFIKPSGARYIASVSPALVINPDGLVVGASLSSRQPIDGDWKGSPLSWPVLTAAQYQAKLGEIKAAAHSGLLQVTINLRTTQSRRSTDFSSYEERGTPTEMQAVGLLLEPGKVLVLADMSRRDTARIESMTLSLGDQSVPLTISAAMKHYGAFLAAYEADLPGAAPLARADLDLSASLGRLFIGDNLSYEWDARDERLQRQRIYGTGDGFLGLKWPYVSVGSRDAFLFTLEGKLAFLPVKTRQQIQMQSEGRYYPRRSYWEPSVLIMPVARLAAVLKDADALDTSYKPLSEEQSKRLAWLGIETQDISRDLARAKDAALETKGGDVGSLVAHVYKDSPADRAGVKAGDIFVRFSVPGQVKPVDVQTYQQRDYEFPWAQLDQVPDIYFERLPRPWPSRSNALTAILTEVGVGNKITATFLHDGRERAVDFTLELAPVDFNSAASYEDKPSGLTVKDVTYELRHYFKMKDDAPGVVVAEIEPGSKASVAGIKPCEIVTAVDGKPVKDVAEFKNAVVNKGALSFTVKRMSQSRVVKISLPSTAPQAPKGPEAPIGSTDSTLEVQPSGEAPAEPAPSTQPPTDMPAESVD